LDIEIRQDFPVLRRQLAGRPIVYLDSAATTLKPLAVLEEERRYSTDFTANVHRGKHLLSEEASDAYESARRKVAEFLSVSPSAICFVKNATEAITTVARGLGLSKSDKVLLPINEHHSNILPWMREASLAWIEQDPEEPLDLAAVVGALERERPRVLAFSATSNVTGVTNPGAEICHAAHQRGVLTCIDASQSVPHEEIDVPALGCDFMAFSGHKMLAPTGIGVLTGNPQALDRLEPLILGGGSVERVTAGGYVLRPLPYRLEAGTPNISGVIGLAAAVDYLTTIGFERIQSHQRKLTSLLQTALSDIKGCRPLMARKGPCAPIGALAMPSRHFNLDDVAVSLSENFGVMARSGHFCAHPLIERLGISESLLRVSAYIYNSDEDIQHFHRSMNTIMHRMS
jgi:cysteine desulfurase/selenocysteine lyase